MSPAMDRHVKTLLTVIIVKPIFHYVPTTFRASPEFLARNPPQPGIPFQNLYLRRRPEESIVRAIRTPRIFPRGLRLHFAACQNFEDSHALRRELHASEKLFAICKQANPLTTSLAPLNIRPSRFLFSVSVELKKINKQFGKTVALDDINFSVGDGELVALLGPSGSGKTTVLRLIAGLEMPDAGSLLINGSVVNGVPAPQRNVGFVFQNYALFKTMTVFNNIAFGLKIRKWDIARIQARVTELINLFELRQLENRYPHQLSGGQKQRVAMARALAAQSAVLLLDEPFAAVDAQIRQELRQWLVRLHQELKLTTIFVTHDQEEAMEVADRIIIFSKGRLEQIGSPREVYEEPKNEFVARFVGVLNVLELEVRDGAARCQELEFPAAGQAEGAKMRVGFRPYAVEISPDLRAHPFQALLRRTYFLGLMLRLELALDSGLVIRSRISKEEYSRLGLADGNRVSFQIKSYRVLSGPDDSLGVELTSPPRTESILIR
jgi:sulfate/thiosulfate transport system ATP-binding protein